ncbi:hypothetical protein CXB51_029234 [Gossypium anomalum]|uniref:RNase H type-1 domain-containing protein n=1 Tax=Gossypium anomalum TaxID=47600 RepID=A0A8J6CQK9_9ROSI|nr:hypothetical protein CXB51_029234 [Gossypium anomalum]
MFKGESTTPINVLFYVWNFAQDIVQARHTLVSHVHHGPRWVQGQLPSAAYYILNTDWAWRTTTGVVSTGGLLRDANGDWLHGFMSKVGLTDTVHAKLRGVREGLRLAKPLAFQTSLSSSTPFW